MEYNFELREETTTKTGFLFFLQDLKGYTVKSRKTNKTFDKWEVWNGDQHRSRKIKDGEDKIYFCEKENT